MSKTNRILTAVTAGVLAVSALLCVIILNTHRNDKTAKIYQDGKLIYSIDIDKVSKPYTIRVDGRHGAYNIIEVRNGSIGITEASCPDKICINTGFISDGVIPVCCMPNKLVIKIEGGSDTPDAAAQ